MDKKLHLLDSFTAQGSDGNWYKVMGYEHMVRNEAVVGGMDQWEPTGLTEYRLAGGDRVDVAKDGTMRVAATGVELRLGDTGPASTSQAGQATQTR